MATGKIALTEGTGAKNIASYSIAEDTVTKELQRVVLSNSSGTETTTLPVSLSTVAVTNAGTFAVQSAGDVASGSTDSGSPVKQGFVAKTALPTAVSDAQRVNAISDKFGRQIVHLGSIRDLRSTQTTTISASTGETTVITAGASGIFNDVIMLLFSNTSTSTDTRIDIRDATAGSVIGSIFVPAKQTVGFAIPGSSVPQTTAANNWTAQCSASTTDIRVFALYEKNK